jgi:hypothetical protein
MILSGNKPKAVATTTTPLGAGATYTSPAYFTSHYAKVFGVIKTDQAGILYIEQTSSSGNWDNVDTIAIAAGVGFGFEVMIIATQLRFRIVNGGVAQTYLRFYSYLRT